MVLLKDHCRIGSLENNHPSGDPEPSDHCRIGSLERNYIRIEL